MNTGSLQWIDRRGIVFMDPQRDVGLGTAAVACEIDVPMMSGGAILPFDESKWPLENGTQTDGDQGMGMC